MGACNSERQLAKKSKQKLEVYRLCYSVTGEKRQSRNESRLGKMTELILVLPNIEPVTSTL